MDKIKQLVTQIKSGQLKPIYFLMGEEPYYIDKLSDYIENNVLADTEKAFNQVVLYGKDVSIDDIVGQAKRYPMMAERQVVIVKEAQDLSRSIDKLEAYALNPQPTTVLVFNYKYKTLDKRKKVYKALKKTAEIFESKPLYENQIPDWIRRVLLGSNYNITPKAAHMLAEFLGTNLSKIENELNKLKISVPSGSEITPELIEINIGISKNYNNFELQKAIANNEQFKAFKIAKYFANNPKDNSIIATVAILFRFFNQLLIVHGTNNTSRANIIKTLRVNPYFADDYAVALRNFPMRKVSQIIGKLRDTDVKGKGVGANAMPHGDLLRMLLVTIFS